MNGFFPTQDMEEVVLMDKILHQKENYDTFSILEQTKVCIYHIGAGF